ncbi:MAG TPA: hypothetical protein VJH90_04430 [archaeon]|nr:hypothetical protein [archaeon]
MADIILYSVSPEKYFACVVSILKSEGKGRRVIYVTTNKPYSQLVSMLKTHGISAESFFFIDCITKYTGGRIDPKATNCIFVENPQSLTVMNIATVEALKSIDGSKMVFFDSLSTLSLYNGQQTMGQFSHFIISKLRTLDVDAVFLSIESDIKEDEMKHVASLVDGVRECK